MEAWTDGLRTEPYTDQVKIRMFANQINQYYDFGAWRAIVLKKLLIQYKKDNLISRMKVF